MAESIRVTQEAVQVEYVDATPSTRVTNVVVQVEYTDGAEAEIMGQAVGIFGEPWSYLQYSNRDFPFNEGTFETWFKGNWGGGTSTTSGWSASGGTKILFDIGYKTTPSANRMTGFITNDASTSAAVLALRVYDVFGDSYTAMTSGIYTSGVCGAFQHYKMCWKLNDPMNSYVQVQFDGSQKSSSGITSGHSIIFGLGPKYDLYASAISGVSSSTLNYTPITIGSNAYTTSTSVDSAKGYFSDIRISDVVQTDNQYTQTSGQMGGWSMSGVKFDSVSNTFELYVPGSWWDETCSVVKVRAVDAAGVRQKSAYFNTSAPKPILIRGNYSGYTSGEPTHYHIYRFRLVDTQGLFPDLRFSINPTSFSHKPDERLAQELAISGRRAISVSPKPAEIWEFHWDNIIRDFMVALKARADSGNSFFLIDHNDTAHYGKFYIANYDEIVATVPSRYRVDAQFIGQGGDDDYRLG